MFESEGQAMELLSAEVELATSPLNSNNEKERTRKTWRQRISDQVCDWDNCKEEFYLSFVSSHAFVKNRCSKCFVELRFYIKCTACLDSYCYECDQRQHLTSPFHHRTFFSEMHSKVLLPTQFVDCNGGLINQDVFVPCVAPNTCASCSENGTL
ncbi:hypothetical protein OUZ56_012429 [Daphnia magna]|uniref:B box-type domain-containing protein n=1 Tax=Daphnia magna TaxID=35525 RepID=A0ABQ9Z348_9CRUS|nr:hypothetical protein OUZ56_012429 [Daphnia magna]